MTVQRQLRFWLIGFIVFFALLWLLSGILLPFVAGMAVAYLLDPPCDRLEAMGLSRTLATTILTVAFLLIIVGALLLLLPLLIGQLAGFVERLPAYLEALRRHSVELLATLEARVDPALVDKLKESLAGSAEQLFTWSTALVGRLISGGVAVANLISLVVITPVVAFYLLRDWDRLVEKIDGWLPQEHAEAIRQQLGEIDQTLAGFVRGQSMVCLILAVFYATALSFAGLDFGLLIGLIAGLLTFIPFVGSAVGLVASVGMALVQFDDWLRIAIVAAIFLVGQAVEGNYLTPKLVGDRVGLHPVWVIFALLAGGFLFGFVGVLLAVPIAAVIGVLIRFFFDIYLASPLYKGSGGANSP
ncbi:MAG: AI-2E family transporter [Pseudomonadota bacterium]